MTGRISGQFDRGFAKRIVALSFGDKKTALTKRGRSMLRLLIDNAGDDRAVDDIHSLPARRLEKFEQSPSDCFDLIEKITRVIIRVESQADRATVVGLAPILSWCRLRQEIGADLHYRFSPMMRLLLAEDPPTFTGTPWL